MNEIILGGFIISVIRSAYNCFKKSKSAHLGIFSELLASVIAFLGCFAIYWVIGSFVKLLAGAV